MAWSNSNTKFIAVIRRIVTLLNSPSSCGCWDLGIHTDTNCFIDYTLIKNIYSMWCWRCFVLPVTYIFTWLYPVHSFPMSRPALTLRICSLKGTIVQDSPLVLPHVAIGEGGCQLALECWHEQLTGQSRQAVKETVRQADWLSPRRHAGIHIAVRSKSQQILAKVVQFSFEARSVQSEKVLILILIRSNAWVGPSSMIDKCLKGFKFLCLLWIVLDILVHWQVAAQTSQNINVCKCEIDFPATISYFPTKVMGKLIRH